MLHVLTNFCFNFVNRLIVNEAQCSESRLCFRPQAGKSPNVVGPSELFSVTGLSLSSKDRKRGGFRNTVLH